jgi:hypothetical protein
MRSLLCLLLIAMPAAARSNDSHVVEVFIPPILGTGMDVAFRRAQSVVADTYSEMGVTVQWRAPKLQVTGCAKQPQHRSIVVAFSWNTPDNFHPGALAFSNPYSIEGACVTIFMDRLKPMLAARPFTTAFLLGHVLTHEMGHVLQRVARHSETGMLKESWSALEIEKMPDNRLHFTRYDVDLILKNISGSAEAEEGPAEVPVLGQLAQGLPWR